MSDECNRSAFHHAQTTGRRVDLEVVLTGNRTDLCFGLLPDQWAVVQCPRNGGFGNPSQSGDISDGADSFRAHILIYATDCILRRQKALVKGCARIKLNS